MSSLIDINGKKFGRLTVISRESNSQGGQARWLCKCDCGNDTIAVGQHQKSRQTTEGKEAVHNG